MKVYIILLNWNNAVDTLECIESLMNLDFITYDIVVCDNESRIDDFDKLTQGVNFFLQRQNCKVNISVLPTGGNLGFAGGVNCGIKYAISRGDFSYVWILNNDTVVAQDALTQLVDHAQHCQAGICGSSLIYYGDRNKIQAFGGATYNQWSGRSKAIGAFRPTDEIPQSSDQIEKKMAYVIGASMLVSKRFIESIGVMREEYFLYSEEHDWAHRGILSGEKLAYAAKSHVFHKHGATIGTNPSGGSSLSLFYLYRAKILFTRCHYPLCLLPVVSVVIWDIVKFALKGYPQKAIAVARGLSRGLLDKGISD